MYPKGFSYKIRGIKPESVGLKLNLAVFLSYPMMLGIISIDFTNFNNRYPIFAWISMYINLGRYSSCKLLIYY